MASRPSHAVERVTGDANGIMLAAMMPRRRTALRPWFAASAIALWTATAIAADKDPLAEQRELFVLAYAAVEVGAPLPSAIDPDALRDYVLYPYLERARFERALSQATAGWSQADDDVRAFLAAHAGEAVSAELRRAWLASLGRREQWQPFVDEFDRSVADARLRCLQARAHIALGAKEAREEAVALWLTPLQLPSECESVFEWLRSQDALSPEMIEQRVRALLVHGESGFARTVARRLPAERAAPLLQWADLLERPGPSIDRAIREPAAAQRLEDGALLDGWTKLARDDPMAAQERYEAVSSLVGPKQSGDYARALGLGLAWSRHAEDALASFAAVPAGSLDDLALQWQARAAMWVQDWKQVERSIGAMSAAQQEQARWRYWAARAAAERGDELRADEIYASILPTDNYYAASAAARLGRRAEPHPETLPADDLAIAALAAQDPFVRTRELLLAGLRGPAVTEWLHALAALDDGQRTQAVHLAARWHWHDVSVATATQQRVFFDYALLYPQPYDREVASAARLTKIDPTLIYGVIRQESLFRTDAISTAGAVGLAQLIPDTARKVAREWQQPIPGAAELLDPSVNITLGAAHLRELMDRFEQQTVVALAGYNAGEFAAERWLPATPIDADVWIENIPYNETRDYVQRVLWHSVVFTWLEKGKASDVSSWLGNVEPRTTTAHTEPGS